MLYNCRSVVLCSRYIYSFYTLACVIDQTHTHTRAYEQILRKIMLVSPPPPQIQVRHSRYNMRVLHLYKICEHNIFIYFAFIPFWDFFE